MTLASLVAMAEQLGPAYDLLAAYGDASSASGSFVFERSGLGVAGSLSAAVPVPAGPNQIAVAARHVATLLASIRPQVDGPHPVVAGAFPFDGEAASAVLGLLSPCVLRRNRRRTWRLEVRRPGGVGPRPGSGETGARRAGAPVPGEVFADHQLRAVPDPTRYGQAVDEATSRIDAGALRKVVLARALDVAAGRELDPRTLLRRLRAVDPDCYTFAVPTATGVLVGASPELLVSRVGSEVRANPLAGSAPRFGDVAEDRASAQALLASSKDREEHAIVAREVAQRLEPFCDGLHFDDPPRLLGTANVWHLSTPFRGRLRRPAPSVLELVAALHPTPAVGGTPRGEAMRTIRELEPFERGCYAGPVGWVDAHGNGEWALALRCAELRGGEARLFAGAGIVAGSRAEEELDETDRKFRALLDALRWG